MIAETTLSLSDYALIGAMLSVAATVVVFNMKALSKHVDKVEDRVRELEQHRVTHADWVRVVASQENRQDRMSEQLAEFAGKLDALNTVGASINALAGGIDLLAKEVRDGR